MSQNQKQQGPSKIIMLAPVALVLIGYGYLLHMPQQKQIKSVQRQLNTLSASQHDTEYGLMDTMVASGRIKKELREIDAELEALQALETDLVGSRDTMRSELIQASLPAATMQSVTSLLERHQLQVLESGPETGSLERAEMVLRPVVDLLTEKDNNSHGARGKLAEGREVYKVRLRGRFQHLRDALEDLSRRQQQVLPLSLQMEPMELDSTAARQKERVWTLVILV